MCKHPCNSCPFNDGITEEASMVQNYGCLPSSREIIDIKINTGHNWACHMNNNRICQALVENNDSKKLNLDMSKGLLYLQPGANSPWISWNENDLKPILKEVDCKPFLFELEEHILEAKTELLSYEFDWDDEGALSTDTVSFQKAENFLKDYAINIYNRSGKRIVLPFINLMHDGSIYVQWDTNNANFLIIFKKTIPVSYFYGKTKGDNSHSLDGAVKEGDGIDDNIADWLKTNL